jgi:hypothetical protein
VTFLLEDDADGYSVVYDAADENQVATTVDAKGAVGDYQEDFYFGDPSMVISTDLNWSTTDSELYRLKVIGSTTGSIEIKWETGVGFTTTSSGVFATIFGGTSGANISVGIGHTWVDGSADTAEMAQLEGDTFTVEVEGRRDQVSPLPGNLLMSWAWTWRTYRGVVLYLTGEATGSGSYYLPASGQYSNTFSIGTITDGIIA